MNSRPPGATHYSPVFSNRPPYYPTPYQTSPPRIPEPRFARAPPVPPNIQHPRNQSFTSIAQPPPPPRDSCAVASPPTTSTSQSTAHKPSRPPFQSLHAGAQSKAPCSNVNPSPQVSLPCDANEDANNQNEAIPASFMQPLFCKICNVHLNAPTQAKQHYEGKNHAKKLKQFMESAKTVLRGDRRASSDGECSKQVLVDDCVQAQKPPCPPTSQSTVDINPEVYCRICEASFNSPKQAEQHYQGKNHAKRLRSSQSITVPVNQKTTPIHITPPSNSVTNGNSNCTSNDSTSVGGNNNNVKLIKFMCSICSVTVTSQDQLDAHLQGVKHLTRVKMQERSLSTLQGRWNAGGETAVNASVIQNSLARRPFGSSEGAPFSLSPPMSKKRRRDFTMYRTPSGKFYCSCCNVTLQTEGQFAQHIDSKKHKSSNSSRKSLDNSSDAS